jgi:N-acetylglutamate synthase-like GNAT family acetyltransferase
MTIDTDKILSILNEYPIFMFHYNIDELFTSIFIIEKSGKAIARAYFYHDDTNIIYLDMLSIDTDIRQQGIGTKLQIIRENIGLILGANTSCLWAKKDTWMYDWYKRRGYEDYKPYEDDERYMWMKKTLI